MICSSSKLLRGLQLVVDDIRRVDWQAVSYGSTLSKRRTESYHGTSLHKDFALMVGPGSQARSTSFIEPRIEKLRPIRVKRLAYTVAGRQAPPMFVVPEPLSRMFSNERLNSVPADLGNLLERSLWKELNGIENVNDLTVCVCNRDERENPLLGSFLKNSMHHGGAHTKSQGAYNQARLRHLQGQVDQDADRGSALQSLKKANHGLLLGHALLARDLAERLKESGQAIVLEPLHQNVAVVAAESKQGAAPLKIAEMSRDADNRMFLLRIEHCLEPLFVREADKPVNVLPVQARRPKQFKKASAKRLY